MRAGIHIANFTWRGGPAEMGPRLADLAAVSEDVGCTRLSFMDHLFQIGWIGGPARFLDRMAEFAAEGVETVTITPYSDDPAAKVGRWEPLVARLAEL